MRTPARDAGERRPGNVRELAHSIERAVAESSGGDLDRGAAPSLRQRGSGEGRRPPDLSLEGA